MSENVTPIILDLTPLRGVPLFHITNSKKQTLWQASITNPEDICLAVSFVQPALPQPGITVIVAWWSASCYCS